MGSRRIRLIATALFAVGAMLTGAVTNRASAVVTPLPIASVIVPAGVEWKIIGNNTPVDFFAQLNGVNPGFGITDAEELTNNKSDAFDGAGHLVVNGTSFTDVDASGDLSPNGALGAGGQTLSGVSNKIGQLTVTAKVDFFGGANDEVARILYTIKNRSRTKKARVSTTFSTAFGSDRDTRVADTTDGDLNLESAVDSYAVTTDDEDNNGTITDAAVNTVIGNSARKSAIWTSRDPGFADVLRSSQSFSVGKKKTVQLLYFYRLDDTKAGAVADGPVFDSLTTLNTAGLLVGLSGSYKNWDS